MDKNREKWANSVYATRVQLRFDEDQGPGCLEIISAPGGKESIALTAKSLDTTSTYYLT